MEFKTTSHYNPKTCTHEKERYFIDGKRVKPSFFDYKMTLCSMQGKQYNTSLATLKMSQDGKTALFIKICHYD